MKSGVKFPFPVRNKTVPQPAGQQGHAGEKPDEPGGAGIAASSNQSANSPTQAPGGAVRGLSDGSGPGGQDLNLTRGRFSPGHNLAITIGGIVVAEAIAMVVVYFFRSLPYYQLIFLDAAVMTVIIFPLIYLLSTRPLLRQIRQRIQTESILQTRLRLIQFANTHSLDELLQATLDEIEGLTDSSIGYFHFLDSDQRTLWLRAWSTNTLQNMCTLDGKDSHYDVDRAGVWADCIRQRQPVIHNDYASLPHRNALPEGHPAITREMSVPIMRDRRIVAILGMGNKPGGYTAGDVELVSTLADFAWDTIRQKQAGEALRASEEKFRTLVDWTYDWETWIDPLGNMVYISPSCERITGYSPKEFVDDLDLLIRIIHPDERSYYEKHHQLVHDEKAGVETVEYRLIARDGNEHWIEHVCRPLFGADGRYLGRRVSNRDITERKQAEKDIRERNQNEKILTQTIHTMQLDIARDLHDTVGQNISFLRMRLSHLAGQKTIKQVDMKAEIQNMSQAADESYDLMRGMLAILQSTNSTDLLRLFTRYAEQIEERAAFKVHVASRGEPQPLSAPRMRQLFYVFREILGNIEKHAHASQVTMDMIWNSDHLRMVVSDNGKGFDPQQIQFGGHYGLKFMRERVELLNGTLDVQSEVGSGTKVEVQIPYA